MKKICYLVGVLAALALLVASYGGHVDPRVWALPALATLALPAVAAVALAIALLMAVLRQWRAVIVIGAAMLVCWPCLQLVFPLHLSESATSESATDRTLRVLTFNVMNWGLYDGTQEEENPSMRFILEQDADIVVMQEAMQTADYYTLPSMRTMLNALKRKYPYRTTARTDLAILSKYPFSKADDPLYYDKEWQYYGNGHAMAWDFTLPDREMRVFVTHMQSFGLSQTLNGDIYKEARDIDEKQKAKTAVRKSCAAFKQRTKQAVLLRRAIDKWDGDMLLVGDLNDTPASYTYRTLRGDDLGDAYAETGNGYGWTYNSARLYFRIDHILYRGALRPTMCRRYKAGDSDHYPLVADFKFAND